MARNLPSGLEARPKTPIHATDGKQAAIRAEGNWRVPPGIVTIFVPLRRFRRVTFAPAEFPVPRPSGGNHCQGMTVRAQGHASQIPAGQRCPHKLSCVNEAVKVAGHAFISYAREDSAHADRLQRVLEAAGIPVWRDRNDVLPGEDWSAVIRRAITDDTLAFLACFSRLSRMRDKSYQNEELLLAIEEFRRRSPDRPWLFPVRFDACDIPDTGIGAGRTLASLQCTDLFGDSDTFSEAAVRLAVAIRRRLDRVPAAHAPLSDTAPGQRTDGLSPGQAAKPVPDTDVRPGKSPPGHRKIHAAWAAGTTVMAAALIVAYVASPGLHGPAPRSHGSSATAARVYSAASYRFNGPAGIAVGGTRVWVTNPRANSVTELNASNGSLLRTLSGARYRFNGPTGIADDGSHVWVANGGGNSVTELNASNGRLLRTLSGARYRFSGPAAIAVGGTRVWVANTNSNSVTELNAGNGSRVATLTGASYGFSHPVAIAVDGTRVWVANYYDKSVTELNASNGSAAQILNSARYGFSYPAGIAAGSSHV